MCKNLNLVASIFVKLKRQDIIVMANQEIKKKKKKLYIWLATKKMGHVVDL
jgi:hypothetical protein